MIPDIEAFEERAAIAEYDGGLSREAAEDLAARAKGLRGWAPRAPQSSAIEETTLGPMSSAETTSRCGSFWSTSMKFCGRQSREAFKVDAILTF